MRIKVGITSEYMDKRLYGIGNYTKNLIENILDEEIDLYLMHYQKNKNPLYHTANEILLPLIKIPQFEALMNMLKLPSNRHYNLTYSVGKFLSNMLKIPKAINNLDLIHVTAPNPSDNLTILSQKKIKKILTIHDMAPMKFPPKIKSLFQEPNAWTYFNAWNISIKKVIHNVDMVIAVSENTKQDIIRLLGISGEKIRVVPEAPAERFKPISNGKNNYIQKPFILSEDVDPVALEAYYKLKRKRINEKLVVFGAVENRKKQLKAVIEKYSLEKDVLFTGYVPDEELVRLYNTASLFLFIHPYEGFGLSPLEAMACGCPVVASNVASLPEVVGEGGMLVDPYNTEEQSDAIYEILTNEGLRLDMIKKGLKRAGTFSWKKTARATYDAYKEVLND